MAWLGRLRVAAAAVAPQVKPLRRMVRGYGSAAAVELDYDYDYDYYEDEQFQLDRHRVEPRADTAGAAPGRGVQWVLIGEPGVKRYIYAERLSKLLQVPHISMGTLVRQELNPRSSLYKQIANAVNDGKLVPEDVIFALLSKRLEEGYYKGENGFILDGIPRTRIQAETLDQIVDVDLVINFKCIEEELLKKNSEFEKISSCPEFLTMGESKDVGHTWKENMRIYSEQVKSVEDHYRNQKKLLNFQAMGAAGDSWPGLLAALHLQHMHALSSSQKLTA
ncbi:hypothetical protein SLE2022_281830 [Rubroshorea leprosula]